MLDNIDLQDLHISDFPVKKDIHIGYSEEYIHTGDFKVVTPESLIKMKRLEFPGIGPCIPAILHSSETSDLLALHIAPHQTREEINQAVAQFLYSHPEKSWTLEYLVRKNPKNARAVLGKDAATSNLTNLNFLADLSDTHPKITNTRVTYLEVTAPVDSFGWDFDSHFFKITS